MLILPSAVQLRHLLDQAIPQRQPDAQGAARLQAFLETVPSSGWVRLEELWRQAFSSGWEGSGGLWTWTHDVRGRGTPRWRPWLERHAPELNSMPGVLTALAFSPDGYLREAAVHLLTTSESPLSTAALLIRANDWVAPVQAAAAHALAQRLSEPFVAHWAQHLALVDRLEHVGRADLRPLVAGARALLRTEGGVNAVKSVLPSADRGTRLAVLRVVEGLAEPERTEWLDVFGRDSHAPLRRRFAQLAALSRLPPLLADRDAGIRHTALIRLIDATPAPQTPDFLFTALFDPRSGIRSLAQYTLRQRGTDVQAVYLAEDEQQLTTSPLAGWIAGLSELGEVGAVSRLEPLLAHPQAQVRLETLRALGRLSPQDHVEVFELSLFRTSPEARTAEAVLMAAKLITRNRLNSLWNWAQDAPSRQRLLRLAMHLPRFDAVEVLVTWRPSLAADQRVMVDERLMSLLAGYSTRFSLRPSGLQHERLRHLLSGNDLDSSVRAALQVVVA
ncbi:HEAT repeat domain-containing protein [Deinococcus sp. QL22]|uniref:HEAT repeat domain-containing protein n=1 Tax=Deinococcus sp. QL22 TaxID=2939437 RepID=UPI00201794F1|nr:hypothetical protein [Deinococcus sp. QL22]UQN10667.1 hypothetical protein M1R55_30290 [Deinococcus sp. QL22]